MIISKGLKYIFIFFVSSVAAKENGSALMACYKAHENRIHIAVCLDNTYRSTNLLLEETEKKLVNRFSELDKISRKKGRIKFLSKANQRFRHWRADQCKVIEASFPDDSSSTGQAYLNCLIDLTYEQIARLDHVIQSKN